MKSFISSLIFPVSLFFLAILYCAESFHSEIPGVVVCCGKRMTPPTTKRFPISSLAICAKSIHIEAYKNDDSSGQVDVKVVRDDWKKENDDNNISESEFLLRLRKRLSPYDLPDEFYDEVLQAMNFIIKNKVLESDGTVAVPHIGTFALRPTPSRATKSDNNTNKKHLRFTPGKELKQPSSP